MPPTDNMHQAREMLVVMIAFRHDLINDVISGHPSFHDTHIELKKKRFDADSVLAGRPQSNKQRFDFHAIHIGERDEDSYQNVSQQQQVKCNPSPPALKSLNSMQRSFTRNIRRMITDTIINNREVYDDVMEHSDGVRRSDADRDTDSEVDVVANNLPTPQPAKKARRTIEPTPSPAEKGPVTESMHRDCTNRTHNTTYVAQGAMVRRGRERKYTTINFGGEIVHNNHLRRNDAILLTHCNCIAIIADAMRLYKSCQDMSKDTYLYENDQFQ
mmetsp:Transcript_43910/g.92401  ORF Transcript_43910/g.92401 Transcript_43910/m.92401 type:complete len:272 (+) Transcript_43910:91-906(+)